MRRAIFSLLALALTITSAGPLRAQSAGQTVTVDRRVAWLKEQVYPIATQDMCSGFADFAPFGNLFDRVHLVGLGEATHGTKDFNLIRNRLIEYLIIEKGYRYLILEAELGDMLRLNHWLTTGEGRLEEALGELLSVYWYDDYVALMKWLREWNVQHPNDMVRFYGNDAQSWRGVYEALEALLADQPQTRDALAKLRAGGEEFSRLQGEDLATSLKEYYRANNLDEKAIEARAQVLKQEMQAALTTLRTAVQASTDQRGHLQNLLLDNLARFIETVDPVFQYLIYTDNLPALMRRLNKVFLQGDSREQALGENAIAITKLEGSARGIYLAHNGHVGRWYVRPGSLASGQMLADALGDRYFAVYTDFYSGQFYAGDQNGRNTDKSGANFTVTPIQRSSLAGKLNQLGFPQLWFTLRGRGRTNPEEVWLFDPMKHFQFGGTYSSDPLQAQLLGSTELARLPDRFDAVIFVQNTRAARTAREMHEYAFNLAEANGKTIPAFLNADEFVSPLAETPACLKAMP